MVKVKRVVHLEDKNIVEEDGAAANSRKDGTKVGPLAGKLGAAGINTGVAAAKDSVKSGVAAAGLKDGAPSKPETPLKSCTSDKKESPAPNRGQEEDIPEERRSTRKIKKKRHKYGEDEEEDDFGSEGEEVPLSRSATPVTPAGRPFSTATPITPAGRPFSTATPIIPGGRAFAAAATPVTPGSRPATPVRGNKSAKRPLPATSAKKKSELNVESEELTESPLGKRPRLARAKAKPADVTPKRAEGRSSKNFDDDDEDEDDDDDGSTRARSTTPGAAVAAGGDLPVEEEALPVVPAAPKETVTFRAGASNPVGLQNLIDFLIRVLRRKDINGFFAHPPTETLCPGYFSRVKVLMDLDLIQQKFDAGFYRNLPAFRADALLLFDNAISYYDQASVIYHTARKLRHFVRKTTAKDRLLGMKLAFPGLLAGIGIEELGLDEADLTGDDDDVDDAGKSKAKTTTTTTTTGSGARDDEGNLVVEVEEPTELLADEDMKIEWIRMEREDGKAASSSRQKATKQQQQQQQRPLKDGASSEDILRTWSNGVTVSANGRKRSSTSMTAAFTVANQQRQHQQQPHQQQQPHPLPHQYRLASVLPRRDLRADGLTSLAILNPDNAAVHVDANGDALFRPQASSARGGGGYDNADIGAAISLKQTLSRLATPTPATSNSSSSSGAAAASSSSVSISGFKEDRRNMLKPVKYVEAAPFCSFGPAFDSRFSNLSKSDSDQLITSFRSLDDLDFAEDIGARVGRAVRGGNGGDSELDAVDGLLDALSGGEYLRRSDVLEARKNFEEAEERMRRKEAEAEMRKKEAEEAVRKRNLVDENDDDDDATTTTTTSAASSEMDRLLASAAAQIESLRSLQTSRLSRPPPPHLALVRPASAEEAGVADGVITALTSMARRVTPEYLVSQRALFDALGVDLENIDDAQRVSEAMAAAAAAASTALPSSAVGGVAAMAPGVSAAPAAAAAAVSAGKGGNSIGPNRLDAPTTPVAQCQLQPNIFQRTFSSGFSFAAS